MAHWAQDSWVHWGNIGRKGAIKHITGQTHLSSISYCAAQIAICPEVPAEVTTARKGATKQINRQTTSDLPLTMQNTTSSEVSATEVSHRTWFGVSPTSR